MHSNPKSYSQLQPEERMTLASLKQQNYSVRAMARVLGRPASTVSRELRRNSVQGHYASVSAQHLCCQHRRQARPPAKLHIDSTLFGLVQHFLQLRWSPEQIAMKLACIHPKGHERRVSHESIYTCSISDLMIVRDVTAMAWPLVRRQCCRREPCCARRRMCSGCTPRWCLHPLGRRAGAAF